MATPNNMRFHMCGYVCVAFTSGIDHAMSRSVQEANGGGRSLGSTSKRCAADPTLKGSANYLGAETTSGTATHTYMFSNLYSTGRPSCFSRKFGTLLGSLNLVSLDCSI